LGDISAVVKESLAMVHDLEENRLGAPVTPQEKQELSGVRSDDEGMPAEPKINPGLAE
jgi:hypothetical protein